MRKRRKISAPPLFGGPSSPLRPRELLADLVLARMGFLAAEERLSLASDRPAARELLALERGEIEAAVLRRIGQGAWDPRRAAAEAEADLEFISARGIRFIPIDGPEYPPQLRESYKPPFGLFLRGSLPDPELPSVAVVGTRAPTGRGLQAAFGLAAGLAAAGVCVVSGLARGIDAAAHRGALSARGRTIAVLPAGIDAVYPPSHRGLAAAIVDSGGALVAEHPPRTDIQRYRFPERNRVIAALCRSCVVVQAPRRSGALITADHALQEGRDVFVHGACLSGTRDEGAAALASQGAAVVNNAGDVFSEWAARGLPRPVVPAAAEEVEE